MKERWSDHLSEARTRCNGHLYKAIRKYGESNFSMTLLEDNLTGDDLSVAESKWISYYNSTDKNVGYNKTFGGERPVHTEESRRKLSESMKQIVFSERHNAFLPMKTAEMLGKKRGPMSEAHKAALSAALKGVFRKKHSDETKAKMRAASKGRKKSPEHCENIRQRKLEYWAAKRAEKAALSLSA